MKNKKCDCAKHLRQFGKVVTDGIFPKYICPKCGKIVLVDPRPIDWSKVFKTNLNEGTPL